MRPAPSGALALAARDLAARAAAGDPEPISGPALRGALSRAAAFDPSPRAVIVTTTNADLPAAVASRVPRGAASAVGVGVARRGDSAWAVVLTSERKLRLDPFPRDVRPGAEAVLSGTLEGGLRGARVFVTTPAGAVREVSTSGDRTFRARIAFTEPGRWIVEVVGGQGGNPEVAGLLGISCGGAALDAPVRPRAGDAAARAADDGRAIEDVLAALNDLRRRRGLRPVALGPALSAVARTHSEAMRDAGKVAHVLPGTGELGDRLRRARIPYVRAYENVGRAGSALDAHHAAEESPAHLANMLRPDVSLVGIGLARARIAATGDVTVYLTQIFVQPPDPGAWSPLTPDARVREALWRARAAVKGAAPLTSDARLDALAREAALAMSASDDTEPGDLSERALGLDRKVAAVDVFVASGPDEAARSRNVGNARFRRVGVGVAEGDSARFGAGRLWIAVVYTD